MCHCFLNCFVGIVGKCFSKYLYVDSLNFCFEIFRALGGNSWKDSLWVISHDIL